MDRTSLLTLRFGLLSAVLAAAVAGCAGNTPMGGNPDTPKDLSTPCVGPKCTDPNGCEKESDCVDPNRPHCDVVGKKCVPCLTNLDCEIGKVCFPATHTCNAGCAPGHGCVPDGGVCEQDAGSCVECNGDNDCLDAAKSRCDLNTHKCFECNPMNDNCGHALVCLPIDNAIGYACKPGCKADPDCKPEVAPDDGGGDADGGAPGSPNVYCEQKKHVCVRCLDDEACPLGRICKGNTCVSGCTDLHGCDNMLACCDVQAAKACVDTTSDFQNCGGCGVQCQGGWNCCNSACSNPVNDITNCGTCGTVCKVPNGTPTCAQRSCAIAKCDIGWADCVGGYMDGCETNIDKNVNNCGACNNACALPNALPKCVGGMCQVGTCLQPWADCDGNPANGCETKLDTDPMNCGACKAICSGNHISQPTCGNGVCNGVCDVNFVDCNGNKLKDGCEVDIKNDSNNCGQCNISCQQSCMGNVNQAVCKLGSCAVTMCGGGFFDVDQQCGNGCECKEAPGGPNACAGAVSQAIGLKAPASRITGVMITQTETWFAFTFAGVADPSLAYRPTITLQPNDNPQNAFSFEVYSDCKNAVPICGSKDNPPKANGELPGPRGWTAWDVGYDGALKADGFGHPMPNIVGNDVGNTPTGNAADLASHLIPIPVNVAPATVFVRVQRNGNIVAKSCGDYTFTLTVSNG